MQHCRLQSATFPQMKTAGAQRGAGQQGRPCPGRGFQCPQGQGTARRPGHAVRGVSGRNKDLEAQWDLFGSPPLGSAWVSALRSLLWSPELGSW